MTYSDNLEKLRQAGVIKVEHGEFVGLSYCPTCGEENICTTHKCITPNPLTIGRVLWWCETHKEKLRPIIKGKEKWSEWEDNISTSQTMRDILLLRHNKDLPLDDQENREEIAEFLVSLIK